VPHENPSPSAIRDILANARTIAIVGASADPGRPSNGVMRRLQRAGYRTIPVNPNEHEVLGERAYARLQDVPERIDIVDVFRRAEATPPIATDAVAVGAPVLWLQQGIMSEEAALIGEAAGLVVIMDACIATAHSILQVPSKTSDTEAR
jgi:predicted CoA-binding protein